MPDLTKRHTTRRNRHRRIIARDKPPCARCGGEIDYEADWLDPMSFTTDHRIPLAKGGLDTLDNIQAMHRKCNREKSDKLPEPITVKNGCTYETSRQWNPNGPIWSQVSAS